MAFLVRLWQPGHSGAPVWHASIENPHTAERHYFADLEALFAFLEEQTTNCASLATPSGLPDNSDLSSLRQAQGNV
jgi:hypothetical protein